MQWTDFLQIGLFQAVITVIVWFLASYIKGKGKNLATREDIQGITDQIESAKVVYAKELEGLKAEYSAQVKYVESLLSRKLHADGLRFEKEFHVYQEVWAAVIDFQQSAQFLRSVVNLPTPKPSMRDEALTGFREARDRLYSAFGKNSPFIAKEVYISLADLMRSRVVTDLSFYKPEFSPPADFPIDRDQELTSIDLDDREITEKVLQIGAVIRERIEG